MADTISHPDPPVEGPSPLDTPETQAAGSTNGSSEPASSGRRALLRRALFWLMGAAIALPLASLLLASTIYLWHARDLPGFDTLADYRPLESTRLVTSEGEFVGELFLQRRTVVAFEEIPPLVRMAFIAAEDERFYDHVGLDYLGIVRALIRNLQAGEVREGASTITQQVVKTFLLTPERRFSRKFKEMILARRLERNLAKDEILYLYLNQIYFGHGRYGVQEAARYYFGKDIGDLDLAEAATLAALPRAPNLYSPRRFPHRSSMRRAYVLRRMVEAGMVEEAIARQAATVPLELAPLPIRPVGEGYIEEVRRQLEVRLGSSLLLGGGLTVEVAMNPRMQAAAESALTDNLRAIDKRQGWRGPLTHLDPLSAEAVRRRFDELSQIRANRGVPGPTVMDLSRIVEWDRAEEGPPPVRVLAFETGLLVAGIVAEVEPGGAFVDLGQVLARLEQRDMSWARPFAPDEHTAAPRRASDVLSKGDVVFVRLGEKGPANKDEATPDEEPASEDASVRLVPATLEQHPLVEGALVAIDPHTRDVVAMVGGYDAERSHFNRATQARRQPGSAFKPFVYGAAIDTRRYTAGSIVVDAPEMFRDPWTGNTWRPSNYDGRFSGDMTLRASLAVSKNLVAVRLAHEIGVDAIIDFAGRSGIVSPLPRFLPLALGSGEVTPMELVNAYATLAASGVSDEPVLVRSVRARDGSELFRHASRSDQTISPDVAFILTDLLTSVLKEGTGRSLDRLDRPTAGKTGTTDDRRDAWFVGYTPELVAGVWIGFDEPQPLGRAEYGGRAAGPAWLSFMQEALAGSPKAPFSPPAGVELVRIDPSTGLLAQPGRPGVYEPFLPDTAPTHDQSMQPISPIDLLLAEP